MKFKFICYEDAMIRLQGNEVLFFNLLKKFSDSYCEHIDSIESLINSLDYMEAYREAHLIKGTASNLSMKNLEYESEKLCSALQEMDKDLSISNFITFKREFNYVLDEIKEHLSVGGSL